MLCPVLAPNVCNNSICVWSLFPNAMSNGVMYSVCKSIERDIITIIDGLLFKFETSSSQANIDRKEKGFSKIFEKLETTQIKDPSQGEINILSNRLISELAKY